MLSNVLHITSSASTGICLIKLYLSTTNSSWTRQRQPGNQNVLSWARISHGTADSHPSLNGMSTGKMNGSEYYINNLIEALHFIKSVWWLHSHRYNMNCQLVLTKHSIPTFFQVPRQQKFDLSYFVYTLGRNPVQV